MVVLELMGVVTVKDEKAAEASPLSPHCHKSQNVTHSIPPQIDGMKLFMYDYTEYFSFFNKKRQKSVMHANMFEMCHSRKCSLE